MLLGILFYILIIPIVEELATVIVQGLEVIKGFFLVTLNGLQNQIKKANADDKEETHTRVIGFAIPDDEEEEDEELYDD